MGGWDRRISSVWSLKRNKDWERNEEGLLGKEAWVFPELPATLVEAYGAWGSGQLHFLWNKELWGGDWELVLGFILFKLMLDPESALPSALCCEKMRGPVVRPVPDSFL